MTLGQLGTLTCGADTNTNTAANTNTAVNTNDNENANANTNTATNTNTSTSTSSYLNLPSSTDGDSDGLTDVEEGVYGTTVSNPDSDGDGFIDGKQVRTDGSVVGELYNLYDPTKGNGGTLETSTIAKRVSDTANTYSVLVPKAWTSTPDAQGGILVQPTANTGEFFKITVADNATGLTAKQWYLQANPSAAVDTLTTVAVNGLEGIISEDGTTVYLFKGTKVYAIQYGIGSVTKVNYRTTFDIIVRSFKLVASS